MLQGPPISTLFPYTTLFRSHRSIRRVVQTRRQRMKHRIADDCEQLFDRRYIRKPVVVNQLDDSGVKRRSEEHTSELQSQSNLVCRLLLVKKNADVGHVVDQT